MLVDRLAIITTKWNLRNPIRIATWNVLTIHSTSHQTAAALCKEMARLDITIAGLSQGYRITDFGLKQVEDSLILYSGGQTHLYGEVLLLHVNARSGHHLPAVSSH